MLSILYGLIGMTGSSAGAILQKKGIAWTNWSGRKNASFMLAVFIWFSGIVLSYGISAIPIAMSSVKLPPHIVSSLTGWSIIAAIYLSKLFLKEKIYRSDICYSLLIVICIILINVFPEFSNSTDINILNLKFLMASPFVLLLPVIFLRINAKYKMTLLSVFSGLMSGLELVLMNVVMKESTGSFSGIIGSSYLYIYFFAGVVSVAALQLAFRMGDLVTVMPLQTSVRIVYPIICTYFLFGSGINIPQLASILLIAFSCSKILSKR